jgi:hypothetical protein
MQNVGRGLLIARHYSGGTDELLRPDDINDSIWRFLLDFACTTRYYNLNSLLSGEHGHDHDPLQIGFKS